VAVDGRRLRASFALRDAFARRLRGAGTRAEGLALGLAVITELAHLFGDALRGRAQAHVAALSSEAQARLLESEGGTAGADDARRIAAAIEALLDAAHE
jgi:hypothetical protein